MIGEVSRWFRTRRMRRFEREFGITSETRVLDIGGTPDNWNLIAVRPRLTLLNMPRAGEDMGRDCAWVAADGRALPFRDGAFDVVFSNSVIEHLGSRAGQEAFAREVRRVGARYFVQTPNRWFPVETHLLTPLVHWLPARWQRAIVPRCTVWALLHRVSDDRRRFYLEHYIRDVRLLTSADMRALFPDAVIVRERFLGFTKSLIAVGQARGLSGPAMGRSHSGVVR